MTDHGSTDKHVFSGETAAQTGGLHDARCRPGGTRLERGAAIFTET